MPRMKDYLMDRAMRRNDMRNPYGSRGGYVRSDRGYESDYARGNGRNYNGNDYGMDYGSYDPRYNSSRNDYNYSYDNRSNDYHYYPQQYGQFNRPYQYEMNYDMRRNDYNYSADYAKEEEKYEKELHKFIKKLESKEKRINVSREHIMKQARNMGVKFDNYDENEFYAVYLMMISDYPKISNDYNMYISMAKDWLEDDDVKMKGGDKLCAYLYTIVLGKKEEDDD